MTTYALTLQTVNALAALCAVSPVNWLPAFEGAGTPLMNPGSRLYTWHARTLCSAVSGDINWMTHLYMALGRWTSATVVWGASGLWQLGAYVRGRNTLCDAWVTQGNTL